MECRSDRTHLDLFSGIGGFALAARWAGLQTIQFVELDSFAQKVLKKNFPGVPIHDDVKTFDATQLCRPWLITGGYPCQPFSHAGKRGGAEDDRHLWPEMLRVIRECRPTWILAENVAGHITMGLDEVLADLESEDYSCRPFVIPACAKDAPHRRDRVWIVARNSNCGDVREIQEVSGNSKGTNTSGVCQDVAYSNGTRWEKREGKTTSPVLRTQQHRGEDVADSKSAGCQTWSSNRMGTEHGSRRNERLPPGASGTPETLADSKSKRMEGCWTSREQEPHTHGQEELPLCEGETVADSSGKGQWESYHHQELPGGIQQQSGDGSGIGTPETVADSNSKRGCLRETNREDAEDAGKPPGGEEYGFWIPEPNVGRVAHGIPKRVDRLRGLGNAIVPQVAYQIIHAMQGDECLN